MSTKNPFTSDRDRVDEFVSLFNRLTEHLQKLVGATHHQSFPSLLGEAARIDATVRHHRGRLLDYGELRNVLVHRRVIPKQVVAVPTELTLERFETIVKAVLEPTRLEDMGNRVHRCFSVTDGMSEVLRYMKDHEYSQVVVQDEGRPCSLVTLEGVATWLSAHSEDGIVEVEGKTVADVLP